MQETKDIFGGNGNDRGVKEIIGHYLSFYPLFIISLALCLGAGYYYIRTTPPRYIASASLLVKGNAGGGGNSSPDDLIESALNGKREVSLNNELVMLKADNLMQRVVARNNFNINYFLKGKVLLSEISESAPFRLAGKEIRDSSQAVRLQLHNLTSKGGLFTYGPEKAEQSQAFSWNAPFSVGKNSFVLETIEKQFSPEAVYLVEWLPISEAAADLSTQFSAGIYDTKTNILELTLLTGNMERGTRILNAVCTEYNLMDIEDRSKLSERTVRFIDERLERISGELSAVEGNQENYQSSRNLVDIKSQAEQSFGNQNQVSNAIRDLNIQQGIVAMISNYFSGPASAGKLVPSSMGLNDETLATLIAQYNQLQLKREREAPSMGPNSLAMQDMNTQIENLKSSILESLRNVSANLRLQESRLRGHNTQTKQFLASVPHNERVMQEIKRKQSITEGLYLYLLQKREEAAISSTAASISNYKQIDSAKGFGPVEPNSRNIYLYTILLGLFLPFGIIYLRDLLNDKVMTREDIAKKVEAPIIGDVVHVAKLKDRIITANTRSLLSEQFRSLRTNLGYLNKTKQVILITSTSGSEGKSFVSINLASILATPGKKVALLEFDIRKPSISETLGLEGGEGITGFLSGEVTHLPELCQLIPDRPNVHLYSAGPVPVNPGDLFLSERLGELFQTLQQHYDYVVVDTAPIGLVTDAMLLNEFSDITLFIIRQRSTLKKQLGFLQEIIETGKLHKVGLVLNDVKTGSRYGYQGYGYSANNSYYKPGAVKPKKTVKS